MTNNVSFIDLPHARSGSIWGVSLLPVVELKGLLPAEFYRTYARRDYAHSN